MSAELLPHLARCSINQAVEDLARLLKKSIRVDANVEVSGCFLVMIFFMRTDVHEMLHSD